MKLKEIFITTLLMFVLCLTSVTVCSCSTGEQRIVEDAYIDEAKIMIRNCGRAVGTAVGSIIK